MLDTNVNGNVIFVFIETRVTSYFFHSLMYTTFTSCLVKE